MVNDSTATDRERHQYHHHQDIKKHHNHTSSGIGGGGCIQDMEESKRNGVHVQQSNGFGPSSSLLPSRRHEEEVENDKLITRATTPTNKGQDGTNKSEGSEVTNGSSGTKREEEDELTKLNLESEALLPGTALVREKSATLTPSSGSGNSKNSFKPSFSPAPGNQNAFMYNARNNLRRSFTLPRGLLPTRKSGQTGPASENQNGNFVRNIFLVRRKYLKNCI